VEILHVDQQKGRIKNRSRAGKRRGERGWSSSNRTIRETDAALPIEPSKRFPFGTEKTVASFAQTQQSRAKSNLTHRAASALPQERAYIWRAETTAVSAADSATPPTRTRSGDPIQASTSVASPPPKKEKEMQYSFRFRFRFVARAPPPRPTAYLPPRLA
jgi:hypothetical protein